jgi:hypothetical protein
MRFSHLRHRLSRPRTPERLDGFTHAGQASRVGKERVEFVFQAGAVEFLVGHYHRTAACCEQPRVRPLVIARGTG